MREPDFENLLKVLRRQKPDRPTLFELFMNGRVYNRLAGENTLPDNAPLAPLSMAIRAFANGGYDYTTLMLPGFGFPQGERRPGRTLSLNEGGLVHDWESFENYPWPDPAAAEYHQLEDHAPELPGGMKLMVMGPCGVLENVIFLVGHETLCLMVLEEPELAEAIFTAVGSRIVQFYERVAEYDSVGALIGNDDWGFQRQTLLSPALMRQLVFPWHKKIVEAAHRRGKPAVLHSCGNPTAVMDDIAYDIGYDGKHSYEDSIIPVEEFYETYHDRIAILGGIDVDFLCRATPDEVRQRSVAMLERSADRGAYALGSGNSIPEYVPDEAYFAMLSAIDAIDG